MHELASGDHWLCIGAWFVHALILSEHRKLYLDVQLHGILLKLAFYATGTSQGMAGIDNGINFIWHMDIDSGKMSFLVQTYENVYQDERVHVKWFEIRY